MKNITTAFFIFFCLVSVQVGYAHWDGDKWVPDNQKQKVVQNNKEIKQRVDFASGVERDLLSKGMDVDVTASGPGKKHFKFKYILIGKPLLYKLTVEGNMLENLYALGFTRAIFTDGYRYSWNYDLKKLFSSEKKKK